MPDHTWFGNLFINFKIVIVRAITSGYEIQLSFIEWDCSKFASFMAPVMKIIKNEH